MPERRSPSERAAATPHPHPMELPTGEPTTGQPTTGEEPPLNRAARRGHGSADRSAARGSGKVKPVRFDHATDPRQYASHRLG